MFPAGKTESTPPRTNAPAYGASKIESTPNSHGASAVSENIGMLGVKVKNINPWIQWDIKQVKECKADAMLQALLQRASSAPETEQPELLQKCLKAVLPVCNGQASTALIKSSDIETALNKYICPGVENNFYGLFIRVTNISLACLEEIEIDGMCAPMHQTKKSIQKPNLVVLPLNTACTPFQDETGNKKSKQSNKQKGTQKNNKKDDEQHKAHMDTNATAEPKKLPWKDVLACIKFKRKITGRMRGIKSSSSTYTVTDHVPTKPEYLLVDHLKADIPVQGPSHAPATQPVPAAVQSSSLTTAQHSKGRSSSKRKATDTLESTAKKSKMDTDDMDADADADPDVTVQTGLYATEMFAANLGVNYLLNIIVVDNAMWIWYYDWQGIIQCSGINFIQYLLQFLVLLYALQHFDLHNWGRNKDFLPIEVEGKLCHKVKIKDEKLGEVDLLLHTSHSERVMHYRLQGQATNMVPVTSKALTKKFSKFKDGMVAKIFWGEVSCTSELEILKEVEEIAKRHATVQGKR
ncbi:hypothetical protein BDR06DRAFT_1012346 [Suillus hirtellus]|nr:hypothetical protein BDR06DRAFT_1012346 [Suillus hirtellus]